MQENRNNKPPPLIWLHSVRIPAILDRDLVPAKATPIRERTPGCRCRRVWARVGQIGLIGHTLDGFHAGNEARAHVDEHVGGRADHWVDLGFNGYGGAGEDGVAGDFGDEDGDLDGGKDPADPGAAAAAGFVVQRWSVLLFGGSRACVAELASFRGGDRVLGTGVVEWDPIMVRFVLVVVVAVRDAVGRPARVVGRVDVYGLRRVVAAEEAVVVAGDAVSWREGGLEGERFVDGGGGGVGGGGGGGARVGV